MTHDKLARQEEAVRELIAAIGELSQHTPTSADFVARVMAQAERLPPPGRGILPGVRRVWGWPLPLGARLAVAAVLVLALLGAVPQYTTWFKAYVMGVPYTAFYEARVQKRLWEKNFACAGRLDEQSSNYAVINGERVMVVVWACPSGDVLVTMESPRDDAARRSVWVQLAPRPRTASLMDLLVPTVLAEAEHLYASMSRAPMERVLCQHWLPNGFIQRLVQLADGRCFREHVNPNTGEVLRSPQAVPCRC